ncbi:GBS Bsp-like repeat-containing protein [Paenibacillus puerhi]|uniref:GBS Bsp-like repeat-containing protein n=1 Tax=Paenibacillus puerhi TaxID=2692622 RepID=UPI0013577EEB|nr:GBS Bsp-like repeat-containing protein [Paenibacillus puerhi]
MFYNRRLYLSWLLVVVLVFSIPFPISATQVGDIRLEKLESVTQDVYEPRTVARTAYQAPSALNHTEVPNSAASGFSSVQGANNWSYQEWDGSTFTDMMWDAVNNRWKGTSTYNLVFASEQHPDVKDSVRKWTAPVPGEVRITGNVRKANTSFGDGVQVKIMKNQTQLWPTSGWQSIAFNDGIGYNVDISTNVLTGDALYFIVNKKENNYADSTAWNPVITYLGDATPPSSPSNLRMTDRTSSTISLGWDASMDNTGVASYEVFSGSTYLGRTNATSFIVVGTDETIGYTFTVRAIDSYGNVSLPSQPLMLSPDMDMDYMYDKNNRMTYMTTSTGLILAMKYDNNGNMISRKVQPSPSVVVPQYLDLSSASYDIYAYGMPTDAVHLVFPTWTSYNGQDDLAWLPGEKVAPGVWKATVAYADHHMETGNYETHVYVGSTLFGVVTAMVNPISVAIDIPSTVNLSNDSYDIVIDGVNPEVARVEFPTWTEANGQDDLEHPYIAGYRIGERKWKITIPFSKHNYETGTYNTHIYSVDAYGNKVILGGVVTQAQAGIRIPTLLDTTMPSYDIYAYGVPGTASSVVFPTWTVAGGQDDLKWVQGQKVSQGVWKATIVLSEHNGEAGLYATHVYADNVLVHTVSAMVNQTWISSNVPSTVSLSSGSYDIVIDGVNPEVTGVMFPTWTEANGQDDLEHPYIKGHRIGERQWKVSIPFSKHSYETGKYITHVYSLDAYGNSVLIGVFSIQVQV